MPKVTKVDCFLGCVIIWLDHASGLAICYSILGHCPYISGLVTSVWSRTGVAVLGKYYFNALATHWSVC